MLLETIHSPADLRRLDKGQLSQLASELRDFVIKSVSHWAKTHPTQMVGTPTLYLVRGKGRPKYFGTGVPSRAKLESAINALLK